MDATPIAGGPVPDTATTLLEALSASGANDAAWARFARLYDPVCRYYTAILRRGWPALRIDWDDDIVQESFLAIVAAMPANRYDKAKGRFRDFLFGIVRMKAIDHARREGRAPVPSPTALEALEATEERSAGDAVGAESAEAIRQALWRLLVDRAFASSRISEQTKAIFLRLVEGGESVAALAAETGMTPNAIYRLKNRMAAKIRDAWLSVAGSDEDPADALEALAKEILS